MNGTPQPCSTVHLVVFRHRFQTVSTQNSIFSVLFSPAPATSIPTTFKGIHIDIRIRMHHQIDGIIQRFFPLRLEYIRFDYRIGEFS